MRRILATWLTACGVLGCLPGTTRAQPTPPAAPQLAPAVVLRALSFDQSGAFVGPASRAFWERVFESDRIPDDPQRVLRGIDKTPRIDAAFVLAATSVGPAASGWARLRTMAFVQRVFGRAADGDLAAVLVAARAAQRYPMLMLSAERMGISDARVYVALARAAERLERINQPLVLRNALAQFQGALALVERVRLEGALSPAVAGRALEALAAVPITRREGYRGAIGGWLATELLPALGVEATPSFDSDAMDQQLLAALAGDPDLKPPVVEWEGLTYRFDRRSAQLERLVRTRRRLGGNRLDAVLALWATAAALASGGAADPSAAIAGLQRSLGALQTPPVGIHVPNFRNTTVDQQVRPVVERMQESAGRGRPPRLAEAASRLLPVVDVLLADVLRTLPYVLQLANSDDAGPLGDDIAARHEFGVRIREPADRARAPWRVPRGAATPPPPFRQLGDFWAAPEDDDRFTNAWHVYGALMSLDVALAGFRLPRMAGVLPSAPPFFGRAQEVHFARGATLFTPSRVTRNQIGALAGAIRRGRARVQQVRVEPETLPEVVRDAGLSPARGNELTRTAQRRPDAVDQEFSRTELLRLGLNDADDGQTRALAGWGAPAVGLDGCLCLRVPPAGGFGFSAADTERLASEFADLPLALAEAADELALPAAIVGELLPVAMRELLDGFRVADPYSYRGRLDALVRYVRQLPRARIEDYVAALVGPGRPLRPVEMEPGP